MALSEMRFFPTPQMASFQASASVYSAWPSGDMRHLVAVIKSDGEARCSSIGASPASIHLALSWRKMAR